MKYFSLVSVTLFLLLSGCAVDFVSRADNSKVYAAASSCHEESEQAETNAINELIKDYPLIARDLKQYVKVDKVDSNGTFCYDAKITKRGWDRYSKALQTRQNELIEYASKKEKLFEYNDKNILVKTMLRERRQFNRKLESAKKLAPVEIEPFLIDNKSLQNSVNVLPSVKIKVHSCNKNRNYNCTVRFFAEVKDESKNLIYSWDFGEGTKSDLKDPTHRYETKGRYSVSLQVTDESGLSTFRKKEIVVGKYSAAQKPGGKNSLKAYFILHKKSYPAHGKVDFDNRSRSSHSKIESYLWEFGDGEKSTVRNPRHRYKKAGKYIVKYKVCSVDKSCAYASTSVIISPSSKKEKDEKSPAFDIRAGTDIQAYIASHGQPSKKIINKKGTTKAYKFASVWLLVKYDKVICAVEEDGFKTTLMGQPKQCGWHKRYAKDYMIELLK